MTCANKEHSEHQFPCASSLCLLSWADWFHSVCMPVGYPVPASSEYFFPVYIDQSGFPLRGVFCYFLFLNKLINLLHLNLRLPCIP